MAATQAGKQRAVRIPLDYYKRPTLLERWKDRLGLLALLVGGGWLAGGLLQSDGGDLRYSRGPVAHVHQTWEANCAACHEPFVPIQKNHWASTWQSHAQADEKCQACHAGPRHHTNERTPPGCAECHREHRGRDASLIRLADAACTQCHDDLIAGATFGAKIDTPPAMRQIRGFSTANGHGDFQHLKEAAQHQKLKFNHKLHMARDLITPENGDPHLSIDMFSESDRRRFEKLTGHIQLECASCHELESGGGYLDARSAGDYMLPVRYQAHCQACHPLTFDRKDDNDPQFEPLTVPHGLQPREIRRILQGAYTAKALKNEWRAFERFIPKRPLPGKKLDEETAKIGQLINDKVAAAEKLLYVGKNACGECHYDVPAAQLVDSEAPVSGLQPLHAIAPTSVPLVWFRHARFSHAAHRGVECRACHENGVRPDGQTKVTLSESLRAEDIFIPGSDICTQCHAPKTTLNGVVRGGARFDCTECHRYHNGDFAAQGLGADRRDPRQRRGIDAFLNIQQREPE
jgi:hypothetical protein